MVSIVGVDKFNGHYVKIFGDFNDSPLMINFEHGRFQKINDDYYWLLCYATHSSYVSFRYKPQEQRLPCPVAVLIKKVEYSTSFKNKDGSYDKLVFKPSPIEAWLIGYLNTNESLLNGQTFCKGYLNIDQTLFTAFSDIHGQDGVNPTSFVRVDYLTGKFDLPDCELKVQSSKPFSNSPSSNSSAILPLDDKSATDIYEKAVKMSQSAYDQLSLKLSAEVDIQDLNNLRLGIYLELLKNR